MSFGKLVGLVALLLGLLLLWKIRFVVLLAFTAIALATVLNRVVQWFTQWKLKRGWAIALTLAFLLGAAILSVTLILPPFIGQVSQWIDQIPAEAARLSLWLNQIGSRLPPELSDPFQQLDTFVQDIPIVARTIFNNFFTFFSGTLAIVVNTLFVLVVTIMLLSNPKAYRRAFVAVFPQFYRHRVQDILDKCEKSIVGWGTGILFNMLVISTLSFLGLTLIGVPLPIGNAFLAGLLTFVPNVGPVLSVVPPALLGLLDAPWKALAVIGLYVLIQQIESNFLTPLVMKHQVALLPAIALVAQLICGVLFGFLGLFLALPIVVTGQVVVQELVVKDIMNKWSRESDRRRRFDASSRSSAGLEPSFK